MIDSGGNEFDMSISLRRLLSISRVAHSPGPLICINNPLSFYSGNSNPQLIPASKMAEKAMRGSTFLAIWHCIFNADSTKTLSSSVTF